MNSVCRSVVRICAGTLAALAVASCVEATQPVRRFPVLDDVGQADWQTVSVGGDHTCALKTDGTAWCWGSNRYGQLGIARADTLCGGPQQQTQFACSLTPQLVQSAARFVSISAGQRHTCAITTLREAFCWGANDLSQVGALSSGGPTPFRIAGALPWVQISAGATHTCAVRSDGVVFCWGTGDRGQIGNGNILAASFPTRALVPAPVAAVSAGDGRTCARTNVGIVYCWGAVWTTRENNLEVTRSQTTPQLVPPSPSMAWVAVGSFSTCGVDVSGFAYCWEANPRGELGIGSTEGNTTPQRVLGNLEFVQVSVGIVQACGVVASGAGFCWGDDSFGQLGAPSALVLERCASGTLPCSTKPLPVIGRQQFTEISTGLGSHTCGVTTKGNLYCWGLGTSGQRGDGTMGGGISTPLQVANAPRAQ
jgi:alpha-tubulin suppressor-like RCC1 family protein